MRRLDSLVFLAPLALVLACVALHVVACFASVESPPAPLPALTASLCVPDGGCVAAPVPELP
ncbi:MAG TPA: hypothetical protein VGL81_09090 [Polyangiaceae bacterium]|jgi:hypothetical protein